MRWNCLAKLDGTSVEEQREKLEKAMDEVEEGKDDPALISEDGRLNNRKDVSFGSSAYVCARVTTGRRTIVHLLAPAHEKTRECWRRHTDL